MMKIILLIAIVAWFVFSNPGNDIANLVWTNSSAPWENVDGYYYPIKGNSAGVMKEPHIGSSGDCKDWAERNAKAHRDIGFATSGYQCGIGAVKKKDGSETYRLLLPK